MKDLIKSINKILSKDTHGNVTMTFNARTEKITVHLKNGYQVVITGRMSIILGFGGRELKITKTTVSPYVADLRGTMSIYIYCDIVQPQVVGDTSANLLRSIPVGGKMGDAVTSTFNNIQYVPVQTKSFENIEILLRSDTGEILPFERGKVIAILHFKRQSSPHFI